MVKNNLNNDETVIIENNKLENTIADKNKFLNEIKKWDEITEEKIKLIEKYVEFLLGKQKEMNLISNSSIEVIWTRHILDSIQLIKYFKKYNNDLTNLKIFDFGSGAGLPGIIAAIMDMDNKYYLFESVQKKAQFLTEVIQHLSLTNVFVINKRIEDTNKNLKADIILSRAMAKLDELLKLTAKYLKKDGYCLFFKGKSYLEELKTSEKFFKYQFSYKKFKNLFNDEGVILLIKRKQ